MSEVPLHVLHLGLAWIVEQFLSLILIWGFKISGFVPESVYTGATCDLLIVGREQRMFSMKLAEIKHEWSLKVRSSLYIPYIFHLRFAWSLEPVWS